MIDVDNYLNDGANYKTQMILCYLRGNQYDIREKCHLKGEDFSFSLNHIVVGRFENCREQGYIFGVRVREWSELDDKWMVVEHRSSDSIKVRHSVHFLSIHRALIWHTMTKFSLKRSGFITTK